MSAESVTESFELCSSFLSDDEFDDYGTSSFGSFDDEDDFDYEDDETLDSFDDDSDLYNDDYQEEEIDDYDEPYDDVEAESGYSFRTHAAEELIDEDDAIFEEDDGEEDF